MTLDELTQGIWNEIKAITKHNAEFEAVKDGVNAASKDIREKYTRGVKEGTAIIEGVEEFAEIYLRSLGKSEPNRKLYSNNLIGMLNNIGEGAYQTFENAIKLDDIDEALRLGKEAARIEYRVAEYGAIVRKASHLSSDQRLALGQKLAAELKSFTGEEYDPFKILGNLYGYITALREIKSALNPFVATPSS